MRWANAALFSLGLACNRLPSTTPLGGREWLPPEVINDKVARAEEAPSPHAAAPVIASAPPAASSAAPSTGSSSSSARAAVVASGSAEFAFKPFAVGDKVELATHYTIRASATVPGLPGPQAAEMESKERIEVRVSEVVSGELKEAEVEYVDSEGHFKLGAAESSDSSNKGKRYRVSFAGDAPRVSALSGSASDDEQKGVVFDLFSVSGYLSLVKGRLPATLSSGWQHQLGGSELERVFGKLDSLHFDKGWLKLSHRDASEAEIWNFQCGLGLRIERDGLVMSADLSGNCAVRAAETRPSEISLRGPLRADLGPDAPATALSGTIEAHITQRYTAR